MKKQNTIDHRDVVVSIIDVYKSFDHLEVLKGISIDLYRGENLVILGRSGSGKSVLIKLVAGMLTPDKGTIQVKGQEVAKLDEKSLQKLRLTMGFLFQSGALYDSMTVRENLEFPLVRNKLGYQKKFINNSISKVLEQVGLLETIDQMPAELSGGQRKRIAIARTLILQPEIMLYDEPTAGLDPVTCGEINDLINEVQKEYKTSSIIITHDLSCAKVTGDRIALIEDGSFGRVGNFEEVFMTNDPEANRFYNYNFTTIS